MTYPMLDHLRVLSQVLTGSVVLFSVGALFACFKLLAVHPVPVTVHPSA